MSRRNRKSALPRGSIIGILGDGQLGRMLALSAARLGFLVRSYGPAAGGPAAQVSLQHTVGDYEDQEKIAAFARGCDVLTYEFENVPTQSAKVAAQHTPLRPGVRALDVAQDRLREKSFLNAQLGIPVAAFEDIDSIHTLRRAVKRLGLPCVVKTRRFGYDGKGQAIIRQESEIQTVWDKLSGQDLIVEQFVPFKRETSIIAARALDGTCRAYPMGENTHENHILHTTRVPAGGDQSEAQIIAFKILDALDYVGVIGVEFFELNDGRLLVNEIAPRVHNSGHWTQNGGCVDQFEQHIRAIAGWPLGDVTPTHGVLMTNLIGDAMSAVNSLAAEPKTHIHLYGKSEIRAGRKMGHVNQILD